MAAARSARKGVLAGAAVAALCGLGLQSAHAVTQTWTGAGADPTDFGLNTNWSNNTLPVTNGDVALFNGLTAGNLTLVDTTNSFPGVSLEAGLTISLGSSQAGSVSIDSPGNPLRLAGFSVASGAGSFTLGGGATPFNVVMGNLGTGAVHTFSNNSANFATIGSNVTFSALGGGGTHPFDFTGSGTWVYQGNITAAGVVIQKDGFGTMDIGGGTGFGSISNGNTVLALGGGTLKYTKTGTNTASFLSTSVSFGGTQILNPSSTNTLGLGTITRANGNAGDLVITNAGIMTGTATLVNGILGPWAVVNSPGTAAANNSAGYTFATVTAAGAVVPYTAATATTSFATISGFGPNTPNFDVLGVGVDLANQRNANTIRYLGAAGTQNINLAANAIMNAGSGTLTLNNAIGGALTIGTNNGNELQLIAAAQPLVITEPIVNNGATAGSVVVAQAPNPVILGGSTSFTGNLTVLGNLTLRNLNAGRNSTLVMNGGSLNFDSTVSTFTIGGLATPNNAAGPGYDIVLQNNALTPAGISLGVGAKNSSFTYAGALSGPGSFVKVGTGVGTLTGNNTYTGATGIAGGTLVFGSAGALPSTSTISFSGGVLQFNPAVPVDYSGRIGNSSGPVAIDTNSQSIAFGTALASTNSGGLSKVGVGTLVLAPANAYTGNTTVGNGALIVTSGDTLAPSGALVLGDASNNSGVFIMGSGGAATNATFTGLSTVGTGAGNAVVGGSSSNSQLAVNVPVSATFAYAGTIGGAGANQNNLALTAGGTGTLSLTGVNTYTGPTAISGGTVKLAGAGAINSTTGITINGTGAKLIQTSSTAITAPIQVTNGTLDGTGTVGAVTVGAGTGGAISNGNGGTGALTASSLTFAGAGAANFTIAGGATTSAAVVVTSALTTSGSNTVTLNVTPTSPWVNGTTYKLIDYTGGTYTGSTGINAAAGAGDFVKGTVGLLSARQTAALGNSGSAITLTITGQTPVWTGKNAGVNDANWTTSASDVNWKLSPSGTPTNFLSNDSVIFDDTATGPTTIDIATNVDPLAMNFSNASLAYSIGSSGGFGIVGPGTLIKSGAGTLTITNSNSYTGGSTLSAGRLNVNNGFALGTGTLTLTGGTIDTTNGDLVLSANNAQVWAGSFAFAGSNQLNLGTGSVTVASNSTVNVSASTLTVGGAIGGTGSITKAGSGTLQLAATSTYSGGTTLNAGVLNVNGPAAIGTGTLTIAGGSLDNTSGGTVTLTTNNPQVWNSDVTFIGSNTLSLGTGPVTMNGNRTVTVNNNALTVGGISDNGSSFSLTKAGNGILNIAGTSTYTGTTTVSAGTLLLTGKISSDTTITNGATMVLGAGTDVFGDTNTVNVMNGGTLDVSNATETIGSLVGDGNVTRNATGSGTLTINENSTHTFSGLIQNGNGVLAITKAGSGTLIFNTGNLYSGLTNVTGGTLVGTTQFAFGSGNAQVTNGGTLILNVENTLAGTVQIAAGGSSGTLVLRDPNAIAGFQIFMQQGNGLAGNATLLVQTDGNDKQYDLAISSLLNGTVTLDRATAGTDVTHPFNSISAGIVTSVSFIPGASVTAGTATVTISTVNLNSSFNGQSIFAPLSLGAVPSVVTISSVTTSGGAGGQSKTINLGGTTTGNSVTGSIDNGNGTLGVVKSGTSTWTLSGPLSYGGITQVTGGILRIAPDVNTQTITSTPALSNTTAADGTDIQGGRLVLDYSLGQTTPIALLRDEVIAGRVLDSLNPANKTVGYADNTSAKQVTALVTWSGDANIDGSVNLLDFNALAVNFGAGPGAYWFQGDFDHNGSVNTADFNLLATNFNQTGGIVGPGAPLPGAPTLGALVPEPASLAVLGLALLGLRRRRHMGQ